MLTGTKQPEKHYIINKQANTFHRSPGKENPGGEVPGVQLWRSDMPVVPTPHSGLNIIFIPYSLSYALYEYGMYDTAR